MPVSLLCLNIRDIQSVYRHACGYVCVCLSVCILMTSDSEGVYVCVCVWVWVCGCADAHIYFGLFVCLASFRLCCSQL